MINRHFFKIILSAGQIFSDLQYPKSNVSKKFFRTDPILWGLRHSAHGDLSSTKLHHNLSHNIIFSIKKYIFVCVWGGPSVLSLFR